MAERHRPPYKHHVNFLVTDKISNRFLKCKYLMNQLKTSKLDTTVSANPCQTLERVSRRPKHWQTLKKNSLRVGHTCVKYASALQVNREQVITKGKVPVFFNFAVFEWRNCIRPYSISALYNTAYFSNARTKYQIGNLNFLISPGILFIIHQVTFLFTYFVS